VVQKRTPAAQRVASHCADRVVVRNAEGKAQLVSEEHALHPDTRPPSKLSQLSSLQRNIAEVPGQVTEERKETRSVNRARTNRKKLIALMRARVCVCERERERELKEQPCPDKPHTEELLRALRGKVYGWRGVSEEIPKFSVSVQDRWTKVEGRQFIYLTKCNAHLLIQKSSKTHRCGLPIL
jgi:citrate synthase